MTLGAVAYDPGVVNSVLQWLSVDARVTLQMSMRYPVYLTLVFAVLALLATLRMHDPSLLNAQGRHDSNKATPWEVGRMIMRAGGWIMRTPMALAIILYAMTLDHTLRMLVTLTSKYYRLIDLPEASFGLLGSLVAVIGLFVPRLARIMAEQLSPGRNVLVLGCGSVAALLLLGLFVPYWGLVPMIVVFVGLMLTSYFTSHYLNAITDSGQRATVLSFKGLALNAAYGVIGLLFAALVLHYRGQQSTLYPSWTGGLVEDQAFRAAVGCFPWYLACGLLVVSFYCLPRMRRSGRP